MQGGQLHLPRIQVEAPTEAGVMDPSLNPSIPLVVRHGIVTQKEWDKLESYATNGDAQGWGSYFRQLVRGNYQFWCVMVHGWDPMPHFFSTEKEAERYDKLLIRVSRGHAKSWRWAIAEIAHDLAFAMAGDAEYVDPRILLIQENQTMASNTLAAVRKVLEGGGKNGVLHAAFPNMWSQVDKWLENQVRLKTGGASKEPAVFAVGLGGALTGMHPKKVIGDDMVSVKNSRTPAARRLHREWWYGTVSGMLMQNTKIRLLHTPYYDDDLHAVLEEDGAYRLISMPALNRRPQTDDFEEIYDSEGVRTGVRLTRKGADLVALWPCPLGTGNCPGTRRHFEDYGFHMSVEYLLSEKYIPDPVKFSSQYMLEIVSAAEQRIKPDMLRFYSTDPNLVGNTSAYNDFPIVAFPHSSDIVACVHAWDHAIGQKKQHDRTAFSRVYRTKDNKVFFINKAGRWSFRNSITMMESNFQTDPIRRPSTIASEGIGFQEAYSQVLREESKEILPVECIKMYTDKDTALVESGLLSHFVNGMVYVDINDTDTIEELLNFTPEQRFKDDLVDAMRIGFHVIRKRIKKQVKVYGRK